MILARPSTGPTGIHCQLFCCLLFLFLFLFCLCVFENSGQQLVVAKVERKTCQMISSIRNNNKTGRTSRLATGNALATKWSASFGSERLEAKFKLFTILVLTMSFRFVFMTTMQHSLPYLSHSLCPPHTANIIVFTFIDIRSLLFLNLRHFVLPRFKSRLVEV